MVMNFGVLYTLQTKKINNFKFAIAFDIKKMPETDQITNFTLNVRAHF